MAWWILPLALTVGVILGLLGGGGAILTVPILTALLGQTPREATAGSLVIVGLSSLVGMVPHLRARRIRTADGVTFGLLGVVGAFLGSHLSTSIRGPALMVAFSVLMLVVAGLMIRNRMTSTRPAEGAGAGRGWLVRVVAATGVGLLTGFFGVGGGFVIVPALTLVMGLPMASAVATSLLVIAINSATSLAFRATEGLPLDWAVILPFAALAVVGTLVGARLSARVDQRSLNLGFIVLLVVVALGVLAQNAPVFT